MRTDEEYVKLSIEKHIKNNFEEVSIIEGDEPPDYYVLYKDRKILLEVTRAESVYKENSQLQNRNTIDQTIIRLCDVINEEVGIHIDKNQSLLLDIKGPLINYGKFKRSIKETILLFLNDNTKYQLSQSNWIELNACGNDIRVKTIETSPLSKRVIGFAGIKNSRAITNIGEQVLLILEDRIKIKEDKTKVINGIVWKEEKWLAILNNYWLASSDTYVRAMKQLKISHTFSKIFFVGEDYEVIQIN